MPQKRGRPLSESTDDAALNRRRQLVAARVREFRQRQRATHSVSAQPTQAQLQQGERIVELGFTDQDAAETLAQLRLRTQGLTLAQDASDVRLQQEAAPVDEHDALYGDEDVTLTGAVQDSTTHARNERESSNPSSGVQRQRRMQPDLGRFFQTLPGLNPFSSTPSSGQREPSVRVPRAHPSSATSLIPAPSYSSITPGGSEDWRHEGNSQDADMTDDEDVKEEEGEEQEGVSREDHPNNVHDGFEGDFGEENSPGSPESR